jgi:hypothetical protein
MKKLVNQSRFKSLSWIAPLLLISLVFILDPRYFSSPPLRSDDWNWIVSPQLFTPLKIIDFFDRRPLIGSLYALITPLFGLKIYWYYVVNWLLLFMTGVVLYQIIKKVFPEFPWLALPVSLVFLVYPVNYARTWLIVAVISFSLLLALTAILFMILFSRCGKWIYLFFGNLLFLLSLGIYEASFGNIMLAAVLLAFFARKIPLKRRAWLSTFLLTGLGFFIWRTFVQPDLIGVQDFYLASVDLSLGTIISRFFQGGFIFLYNWVGPIFSIFKDKKYLVFIATVISLVIILIMFLPRAIKNAKKDRDFNFDDRLQQVKSLAAITFLGLLFWAAGYIPVISVYQPTFYGDSSRVNYTSIPGAALALFAGFSTLITLIVPKKKHIERVLLGILLILLVFGSVLQIHSQNVRFQIWEIKKAFWNETFKLIPNITDNSIVVIVIPGFESLQPFEMLPFIGDWEAESALQVLYNDPTLFAEYYYRDIIGHPDNWNPTESDLSRYIFLFFDPNTSTASLIDNPVTSLAYPIPIQIENYNPENRIEAYRPEIEVYRFLVR